MFRRLVSILFAGLVFFVSSTSALATYNPLSYPNNRVGVHIFSPDEISDAAKLVNNNGKGAWGYVTVPIQATDRDRDKWIRFMKKAAELKVIPIVRVATFASDKNWLKPGDNDLIDFANFLNELPWPIQNRYVIIFNEVNRPDEFGGSVSPEDYADILNNAIDIFKSRSDKFFILPAGLDNAAPNNNGYMRWDTYLTKMYSHRPEIFNRIDGWTSHSYGNPNFSMSPVVSGSNKADSFKYDLKLLNQFTKRRLPVFITETGWANPYDSDAVASFYNYAFVNLWSNDQVVAVTPFVLFADNGPFTRFSLLRSDHSPKRAYDSIASFAQSGEPVLEPTPTPSPSPSPTVVDLPSPVETSSGQAVSVSVTETVKSTENWFSSFLNFFKNLFSPPPTQFKSAQIGQKTYRVEIVTKAADQARGLAKYSSLPADQGMLFDFGNFKKRYFWMKDMKFDIDIIWLNHGVVVGVIPAYAKDGLKVDTSPDAVDQVLEVNLNSGIQVGDQLVLQ